MINFGALLATGKKKKIYIMNYEWKLVTPTPKETEAANRLAEELNVSPITGKTNGWNFTTNRNGKLHNQSKIRNFGE